LEDETRADIALAGQRREANERYFRRVNESVLDVVGKLEDVAKAMRGVEERTREIWGDGESLASATETERSAAAEGAVA
ncbi:hypothetical protein LTR28_012418, partial [Elasticomyces elasticus]